MHEALELLPVHKGRILLFRECWPIDRQVYQTNGVIIYRERNSDDKPYSPTNKDRTATDWRYVLFNEN